jgi:hypothetical protein
MKYSKPEVNNLDQALSAIQHFGKPASVAYDIPLNESLAATTNAYEADE